MVKILDHGYVKNIESWGSDEKIIEAARMSTDGSFRGWNNRPCSKCKGYGSQSMTMEVCQECRGSGKVGDEKLLRFLYTHKHMTPFEMAGLTLEVQAPIFVFREWMRHRTFSFNEMSGRYTTLPDLYYVPSVERIMEGAQSSKNKQGSEGGFNEVDAESFQRILRGMMDERRRGYESLLEAGLSRELSRLVLPVSQFSRMRTSGNLRNWMQFLTLRLPESAQFEIRCYATEIQRMLTEKFPRSMDLFNEEFYG